MRITIKNIGDALRIFKFEGVRIDEKEYAFGVETEEIYQDALHLFLHPTPLPHFLVEN